MSTFSLEGPVCRRCKEPGTSPKAFLLTCRTCQKTWHHSCHLPIVTEKELMRRLAASHDLRGYESQEGLLGWLCNRCSNRARNRPKVPPKHSGAPNDPICVESDEEKEQNQLGLSRTRLPSSQRALASGIEVISLEDDEDVAVGPSFTLVRPSAIPPVPSPSRLSRTAHIDQTAGDDEITEIAPSSRSTAQNQGAQPGSVPLSPRESRPVSFFERTPDTRFLGPRRSELNNTGTTSLSLSEVTAQETLREDQLPILDQVSETEDASCSPPTESKTASTNLSRSPSIAPQAETETQRRFIVPDYIDMDQMAEGAEIIMMSSSGSETDEFPPHEPELNPSRTQSQSPSPSFVPQAAASNDISFKASSNGVSEGDVETLDSENGAQAKSQTTRMADPMLSDAFNNSRTEDTRRSLSRQSQFFEEDVDMEEVDQILSSDKEEDSDAPVTKLSRMRVSENDSASVCTSFTPEPETEEQTKERLRSTRREVLNLILGHAPPLPPKSIPEETSANDYSKVVNLLHQHIRVDDSPHKPRLFCDFTLYSSVQRRKLIKPRPKITLMNISKPRIGEAQKNKQRPDLNTRRDHQHQVLASNIRGPSAAEASADRHSIHAPDNGWEDSVSIYVPPRPQRGPKRTYKIEPLSQIDLEEEDSSDGNYEPSEVDTRSQRSSSVFSRDSYPLHNRNRRIRKS